MYTKIPECANKIKTLIGHTECVWILLLNSKLQATETNTISVVLAVSQHSAEIEALFEHAESKKQKPSYRVWKGLHTNSLCIY